jgi:hypothetical protein
MNYDKCGPYCDYYDWLKRDFQAKFKTLYHLVGGNPRYMIMLYENMKRSGINIEFINLALEDDSHRCPCHDAPDPKLFRKFFAYMQLYKVAAYKKSQEEILSLIDKLTSEFLKENNLCT